MATRDGMKEKKCGCVIFDFGPPILCDEHQAKATQRAAREQVREEKGLRKLVQQQARDHGHDLSVFREYKSLPGKWTAFCHSCGAFCIVYDAPPTRGDQIAGRAVFERCTGGSATFRALDAEGADEHGD